MTQNEANQLNEARQATLTEWAKACKFDGIPTDSRVAIFSDDNPHAKQHNELMGEFFKLRNRIARNIRRRERHAMANGIR